MPFELCNTLTTFQKIVTQTFKEYFNDFMQIFLDDFNVYGNKEKHLNCLNKCISVEIMALASFQKMCIFCEPWNIIGTYCLSGWTIGGF